MNTGLDRRKLMRLSAMTLLLRTMPLSGSSEESEVGSQIKRLEQERGEAQIRGDAAKLDELLAPEFIEISATGMLRTRKQNLEGHIKKEVVWSVFDLHDISVEVFGETAVVRGRLTRLGTSQGHDISGRSRYTRYYLRRQGKWQAVFHHGVPEPEAGA